MFGFTITRKDKIQDVEIKLSVAELQTKIEKTKYETARESWKKALEDKHDQTKEIYSELLRKCAYIDQLNREIEVKNEIIAKLEKYRPVQGTGGRFIKKTMQAV